ncbi:MAG: bifunctional UDP-N-acetylmuramoyl-tripeptide:D-alanyl-D-alanine ligase/alanine racemase, partial [Bacteroidales bacterium]|nr:bifunctional UDP-N-acetylmuramoyl-tripeptide:D-alanyl-D-alanine ligase/alanine racemase [Bacteroidales bacterium]
TIVKEWLYHLLFKDFTITRSPKSYNSQIGVPLAIWQMAEADALGIFEAGISKTGEMDKLQSIIQPTAGIFTNIGSAHDEGFQNREQKIREKLKLFKNTSLLIYRSDHKQLDNIIRESLGKTDTKLFRWGEKEDNDLIIRSVEKKAGKTTIHTGFAENGLQVTIDHTDDASIENALHCLAYMITARYNAEVIQQRMQHLPSIAMRLEMKEGINNCSLVNDSYSSDLDSLKIALDFINQQKQHPKKTIILSDIVQSGKEDRQLYSEVSRLLKRNNINRLIGIGDHIGAYQDVFDFDKAFFSNTDTFIMDFPVSKLSNETILLKGARKFEFEKISNHLQQKAHETVLNINLNALIHNLNYYRQQIGRETKIMAMVKAFSYGSGSFEIANILQFHRADYLAVAYADEGIELRKAGITLPIMVMNPEVDSFDGMINYKLEPEIYSFRTLNILLKAIERNLFGKDEKVAIHLKLDTGMHRLGFEEQDIDPLIELLQGHPQINIKSVFSHLAASEDPEEEEFTRGQIELFKKLSDKIRKAFDYSIMRHILNSAGITRYPDAQFDMVRLGISLYGVAADRQQQKMLQNVSTLRSTISQIRKVKKGGSISYGRNWIAEEDIKIAVVGIGYADGLNRKLSNGVGDIMVHGKRAKIVGDVCMDMCMIDITGIDAEEGDEVIIFGNEISIKEVARKLETIPYEILTGISRRVKRVYYQE